MPETTPSGQTFCREEADKLFPAGCQCQRHGGGDCDWCQVYYDGPPDPEALTDENRTPIPQR